MTSLEGQFIEATRTAPKSASESEPTAEMELGPQTARVLDAKDRRAANAALGPASVLHLQRAAGNASVAQLLGEEQEQSPVKGVVGRGGGEPLDDTTRVRMESALGADFSDVRVHSDGSAAESARAVSAHAYTVGNEVVFSPGRFDPATPTGQRTLAHELTHVVQQRAGPVDGTPAAGGIRLSDPSDRYEQAAERSADQVLAHQARPSAAVAPSAGAIQREGEDEEPEVQSLAIQREGEDEEPEVAPETAAG
ncbi:MAG TPA: DUF4157 domain-containing protein [Candidatus Eisenbacteria bacterium]|nr:DUF4157 domain-containing protein [Candidatus Eisenbacteria bacterium]